MNTDERLAVIETKVDDLIILIGERQERMVKTQDTHDTRIRGLERWRNMIVGGMAVVTAIMTYVFKSPPS